jgi:hypothetical protein
MSAFCTCIRFSASSHHRLRAVDDLGAHLLAAVRGQAVHEQGVGVGGAHHLASTHQSAKAFLRASFSAS